MDKQALQFLVPAEQQAQVRAFRADVSQTITRYFIKRNGRVMVIVFGEDQMISGMRQVSELPPRGTYEPYAGTTGGAWQYTIHPLLDGGCELKVEFTQSFPPYPEEVAPLYLVLPDDPLPADPIINSFSETEMEYPDPEKEGRPGMIFHMGSTCFAEFNEWAAGRPWTQFDFIFIPTTVCVIQKARYRPTGDLLDLTANFEP
jgi:hypothetical protein